MGAVPMSWKSGDIRQMIQSNPFDVSDPGNLIPKTAKIPILAKASLERPAHDGATDDFLKLTQPEKLAAYLSDMSYSESLAESVNWVLQSWGAIPKNHSGLNSYLLNSLGKKYGLSVLTINSNMKRLVQLNQPAILEIALPDFQGSRYVALTRIGNGQVDRF